MKTKLLPSFQPAKISADIDAWIDEMADGLPPGRFHYCKQGAIIPTSGQQGQMTTCFTMKAAWQSGLWDNWSDDRRLGSIDFIQNFQQTDGTFIDPWLTKSCRMNWKDFARAALGRKGIREAYKTHRYNDAANIRAETRQSAATLWMVDELPKHILPLEAVSRESFKGYIGKLNWSDPWHAGSQTSHQLMMLSVNNQITGGLDYYDDVVAGIMEFLNSIYDKDTGTWHQGNDLDDQIKLNGAMKIYSGLQWLDGVEFSNKALIDFALTIPIQLDGCGFTNSLFAIRLARRGIEGYRQDDIIERSIQCLNHSMKHKHDGSGYSFLLDEAQRFYYTQYTSSGGNQADMHGTGMFALGVAIALELMGDHAPAGAELWRSHRG